MKTRLAKPIVITLILFTLLSTANISHAADYTTSYSLLDKPGGNVAYTLNIVVPQQLLEYYQDQTTQVPSARAFPHFVTPYAVKPIADVLQGIYPDEEDFANSVLSIVHQMNYVETVPGKYPVETLVDNTGDCDIFSFVAASIIKARGLDVVLFYYEEQTHMNVGVHLADPPKNTRGSAYSITHDNTTYYISECTGGNLTYGWRIGECPDNLKQAKAQVITLENAEQIAPGQVSASLTTLESSDISLEISPAIAIEKTTVTFRGQLTPTKPNQNITIYLGISGTPWTILCTTETQQDGSFTYTWNTPSTGLYAVRASWSGDKTYASAVSSTQNGTVLPILLTALIGLAVLSAVIGAAAILFSKHTSHENLEPTEPQPPTFS
jgi:hypothetical protein